MRFLALMAVVLASCADGKRALSDLSFPDPEKDATTKNHVSDIHATVKLLTSALR